MKKLPKDDLWKLSKSDIIWYIMAKSKLMFYSLTTMSNVFWLPMKIKKLANKKDEKGHIPELRKKTYLKIFWFRYRSRKRCAIFEHHQSCNLSEADRSKKLSLYKQKLLISRSVVLNYTTSQKKESSPVSSLNSTVLTGFSKP